MLSWIKSQLSFYYAGVCFSPGNFWRKRLLMFRCGWRTRKEAPQPRSSPRTRRPWIVQTMLFADLSAGDVSFGMKLIQELNSKKLTGASAALPEVWPMRAGMKCGEPLKQEEELLLRSSAPTPSTHALAPQPQQIAEAKTRINVVFLARTQDLELSKPCFAFRRSFRARQEKTPSEWSWFKNWIVRN